MRLEKMPLFDIKNPGRGNFFINSGRYSTGTEYGPLLTDTHAYLCPDCGGHGLIFHKDTCAYCGGEGEISLDDARVLPE